VRAAQALGIREWRAACTPQDKAARIDELARAGKKVLMVGDGLNDAGALAKAHAAMAPGTALEASQNAADLVFSGERLGPVVAAFDVARSARKRALENFGFAALYNAVAAPAAMLGLVNPFVAAIAMSGSSLIVTLNALRTGLRR
jgi:Cu2+-exporting ATPase